MAKSTILLTILFILPTAIDRHLLAQGAAPNIRIHPNPSTYQFELSVATHPLDSNILLVASVARTNGVDRFGWYYTTDGGNTWSGRDTLPTHTNLGTYMRDPGVGIDLAGNLFVSGFYGPDVFVARSTNGGTSWSQTTIATTSNHERPHIAIDLNPTSPYQNYIYAAYSDLDGTGRPMMFCRSTDQGQTFSAPVSMSDQIAPDNVGVNLAVGPDSSLYAIWPGYDSPPFMNPQPWHLGFNRSKDGGLTWDTARAIKTINYNGGLAHPLSFFNCPVMAVDRSNNGPRRGWIYIVYTEKEAGIPPDIFLIRSTDRGGSWSSPLQVNQDASSKNQWQPWVTVDPSTGNLFVVYYDSRNFPANDSAEVSISASTDGGLTFTDTMVSDSPFLPRAAVNYPPVVPYYMGSYIGITALNGIVSPVWTDTRPGIHQAYTSRIVLLTSVRELPGAIPGAFALEQNYPNPFNPSTKFGLRISEFGLVTLKVYNLLGQEVATLVNEEMKPGSYEVTWDAAGMPSGVYLYRLQAGEFAETKKLLLLR